MIVVFFFPLSSFECRDQQVCNLPLLFTGSFGLLGTNSHLRRKQNYHRTQPEAFYYQYKVISINNRNEGNYVV